MQNVELYILDSLVQLKEGKYTPNLRKCIIKLISSIIKQKKLENPEGSASKKPKTTHDVSKVTSVPKAARKSNK